MKINTGQYELDLITAILSTNDNTKRSMVIDKIKPDMIQQLTAKRAWEAVTELHNEGEIVDFGGVTGRMGGADDLLWLAEIMGSSCAIPANLTGYAKRVRQASYLMDARQRAVEALSVIDELSDITQVETVAGSIENLFEGLLLETNDRKPQLFKDVAKDYIKKMNDKLNGQEDEHVILSNIKALDYHTGGFNITDMIVIAGLSGSGKTEAAIDVIRGVTSTGGGALIFSLEMSNHQVVERAISGQGQLPVSSLRNPKLLGNVAWKQMERGLGELVNRQIYMEDQTDLTIDDIVTRARRHKRDHPEVRLFVVDHIGLMKLGKIQTRHDLAVGDISRRLKSLAKELETPVVILSQLTSKQIMQRGLMDREPRQEDIKDSTRIIEDADLVIMTHNQHTHDDTAPNIAEWILAKARHAIRGTKVFFSWVDGHFVPTAQDMASNQMEAYRTKNKPVVYEKSNKLK